MPSDLKPPGRRHERPFQFSLATLFGVVAAAAVAVAWVTSLATGVPEPIAVLAAVVAGVWIGLHAQWRTVYRVLAGIAVFVVVVRIALPISSLAKWVVSERYVEYHDIGTMQFNCFVGWNGFKLREASHIYFARGDWRDGYDYFWRMAVPRWEYEQLLTSRSLELSQGDFGEKIESTGFEMPEIESTGFEMPANWPVPDAPTWWRPRIRADSEVERTCWELQKSYPDKHTRSLGWYWVYEEKSETLWIWEWNHQHCDLGW